MSIQFSVLICVCIALTVPLLVMSTPNQFLGNFNNDMQDYPAELQQPVDSFQNDESNDDHHFVLRKATDFEQILKPCNRMPASGRGQEYADCVRSRMLLMGKRRRRNLY